MADLGAIEIPIIVRGDTQLKGALNTVTRLERELTRAVKAVDNGTMSQRRFNQILTSAKQQYKDYAGNAGLATININKFVKAQFAAAAATNKTSTAVNNQSAAFTKQTAVVNNFNKSQMAATKGNNRFGVVAQQTGYQVGDFLVQVQSGTNFMVAFGQQATQLVGILPLLAPTGGKFLGLSTGALIGLSAALGILIPLFTALGAAFMKAGKSAEDSAKPVFDFAEASSQAASEIKNLTIENYQLANGIKSSTQAMLDFAIKTQEAKTAANDLANEASLLFGKNGIFELGGGFTVLGFEIAKTDEEKLALLQQQRQAVIDQNSQLEAQKSLKDLLLNAEKAITKAEEDRRKLEEDSEAIQRDVLVSLRRRNQLAEAYLAGGERAVEQEERIHSAMELVAELQSDRYDLSADEVSVILRQLKATLDLEDAVRATKTSLEESAEAAQQLADALNSAAVFSGNLDKSVDALRARLAEAKGEQGAVLANTIEQMRVEARLNAARIRATQGDVVANAQLAIDQAQIDQYAKLTTEIESTSKAAKDAKGDVDELQQEIDKLNKTAAAGLTPFDKYNKAINHLNELRSEGLSFAAYSMEIERLNDELAKSLPMVNDVADAFGDFLARGLTDFKSFANSIFKSFQNMLAQMIATAVRNKILISMGATGSAAGTAASAGVGGAIGASIGGIGAGIVGVGSNLAAAGTTALGMGGMFTGSFGAGMGATMTGGLAGGASAFGTGVGMMGTAGSAMSGFAMAAGAALPVIAAVAVAVALFRKKTKELDSGLNVTVKNMDALVTSFKTVQTSRFFGLSKKTSTSTGGVSSEVSDPIVAAVQQIQQSVLTAAEAFGFGADAFDNFSYKFKLSLKGLSEEQQMQKINEELAKMGDSFASLTGHFSSMNELLEAAEQRYQIENRMLEALGNSSELLARNRERELAATHALNRGLLQATFDLEDANAAVSSAMDGLRRAIDAEKTALQTSFDAVFDGLRERLDLATEAVSRSRNIFNMLSNSLKSRSLGTMEESMFRRSSALSFLQSGDISDEKKLESALQVVSEPSEGLFTSFVDYAREFLQTSRVIGDLEKTASIQLTADEKAVLLLEQQIEANKASLDSQLAALEKQYQVQIDQFNALMGIDTSVKSVGEAIATLKGAIEALAKAQEAAKAAAAASAGAIGGGSGGGGSPLKNLGTYSPETALGKNPLPESAIGKQYLQIRGEQNLLSAAQSAGVPTKGKSGAEIQQALSNSLNAVINMDNATRGQQFARGGMFDGGMRLVGEEGPELEVTGPSRIYSKQQTKELLRGGDSNEGEGLRAEVSEMRQELRQLLIANNKYTKRSYDLYNKWDIDGLPAERT